LNGPIWSALIDANFAGNGATWLILKHQAIYIALIVKVSVLDERIGDDVLIEKQISRSTKEFYSNE